jgi:hypothetical protein
MQRLRSCTILLDASLQPIDFTRLERFHEPEMNGLQKWSAFIETELLVDAMIAEAFVLQSTNI